MPYGRHPYYESARDHDRQRARDEIRAFLDRCNRQRARLASTRVLETLPTAG